MPRGLLAVTVFVLAACGPEAVVEPAEPPTVDPAEPEAATEPTPTEAPPRIVPLVPRGAWSAQPVGEGFVPHQVVALTVHHTAVVLKDPGAGASRARTHQRDHIGRGWPDLAYHFLIDGEGSVFEGRPTWARGDTATGYDPTGYLLVTLEGNFEEQEPTAEQLEALVSVLAWGSAKYGVAPAAISGHRDHAATLCPGRVVAELLGSGEIARRVQAALDAGPVRLEPAPASAPAAEAKPPCRVGVDVGHSGAKPGATSASGRPEWEFNRRFAGELVRSLPNAFLVDPAEEGLLLKRRPAAALEGGADLFLSIHHDSVQEHYLETTVVAGAERRSSTRFRGHSFFVSALGAKPAESERLGRAVGAAFIDAGFVPTKHHAEPEEGEDRPWVDEALGLYRFDGLAVLRHSELPSVLVEGGVLPHPEEEADLDRAEYRTRLVAAVVAGTQAFCSAEGR